MNLLPQSEWTAELVTPIDGEYTHVIVGTHEHEGWRCYTMVPLRQASDVASCASDVGS